MKPDDSAETALHVAASNGHEAIVTQLIAKGGDINQQNNAGYSALIYAAGNGHETIVQHLSYMGADHNVISEDGYTASTVAAGKGHKNIVEFLDDFPMNPIEELYKKIKREASH